MEVIMIFGKKGKSEINWPIVLLVVITAAILFPALPEKLGEMFGLEPAEPVSPTPSVPTPTPGCYIEDTTMTLTSEEMFNPSTTPGGDHRVWIDGKDQGLVADGGSITVSPGNEYEILWVENSTTHYGRVTSGIVPCSGTLKLHEELYQWGVGKTHDTWANLFNDDGTLNTGTGTTYNLSLDAGERVDVEIQLKGTFEDAIGNPDEALPNVLTCAANTTAYDDLILHNYDETGKPAIRTAAASMDYYSWKLPAIVSSDKLSLILTIDVDDTYDPIDGTEGGTAASWITCWLDDGDYDIHSDTNEIIFGVEDDQDTNLGLTTGTHNFTFSVE
jgi:hypothetical protein